MWRVFLSVLKESIYLVGAWHLTLLHSLKIRRGFVQERRDDPFLETRGFWNSELFFDVHAWRANNTARTSTGDDQFHYAPID